MQVDWLLLRRWSINTQGIETFPADNPLDRRPLPPMLQKFGRIELVFHVKVLAMVFRPPGNSIIEIIGRTTRQGRLAFISF